jgi:phosphopantetheinyl transferase
MGISDVGESLQIHKREIYIHREKDKIYKAGIALIKGDSSLLSLQHNFLSTHEQEQYEELQFQRRKNSFLQGRISAKVAIDELIGTSNSKNITIEKGVFGFPVVKGVVDNIQLSISHTAGFGVCIANFEEHPMGIDVEKIDVSRSELLQTYINSEESLLLIASKINVDTGFFLWTIKEALSKILKTGLTLDFKILQIKSTRQIQENIWESTFTNFSQYKAISIFSHYYALSMVLPLNSTLSFSDLQFILKIVQTR